MVTYTNADLLSLVQTHEDREGCWLELPGISPGQKGVAIRVERCRLDDLQAEVRAWLREILESRK